MVESVPETALRMEDPSVLIGRVFDERYRIDGFIGQGGMGAVFRARQLSMDNEVALKVLALDPLGDERHVRRFNHEALASSKLRHPNTIRVLDFGRSKDGHLFLAMELLEGRELAEVIESDGAIEPARALRIARQITKSVGEAHDIGLVHRDLKPGNVFLCHIYGEEDFVKVLDFGIAKFVDHGEAQHSEGPGAGYITGTPLYLAPEQALGRTLGPQSDLYSLGVMIYEMLTGLPPFGGETPIDIVMRHIQETPLPMVKRRPDLRIPTVLEMLVARLLAKDPSARPESAEAVGAELDEILESGELGDPAEAAAAVASRNDAAQRALPAAAFAPTLDAYEGVDPDSLAAQGAAGTQGQKSGRSWLGVAAAILVGLGVAAIPIFALWPDPPEQAKTVVAEALPGIAAEGPPHRSDATSAKAAAQTDVASTSDQKTKLQPEPEPEPPAIRDVKILATPAEVEVRDEQDRLIGTTPFVMPLDPAAEPRKITLRHADFEDRVIVLDHATLVEDEITVFLRPKVKPQPIVVETKPTPPVVRKPRREWRDF